MGGIMAENREQLHDLRKKGHEAGIQGSSKMTAGELRGALRDTKRGKSPEQAKKKAKKGR
ncbi:hypothetical protein D5H75_22335 [Bailinhaonella thermotolerans]|uniref:Uncharacterized protein n=2 Tax=Bailinhaonella thermotolerans TaxID=1070861 RepID=A0A3A4AL00_9ACTN|nr:hypothetical protein D5H75_22335 [Bailinhaonella thermotolerans]